MLRNRDNLTGCGSDCPTLILIATDCTFQLNRIWKRNEVAADCRLKWIHRSWQNVASLEHTRLSLCCLLTIRSIISRQMVVNIEWFSRRQQILVALVVITNLIFTCPCWMIVWITGPHIFISVRTRLRRRIIWLRGSLLGFGQTVRCARWLSRRIHTNRFDRFDRFCWWIVLSHYGRISCWIVMRRRRASRFVIVTRFGVVIPMEISRLRNKHKNGKVWCSGWRRYGVGSSTGRWVTWITGRGMHWIINRLAWCDYWSWRRVTWTRRRIVRPSTIRCWIAWVIRWAYRYRIGWFWRRIRGRRRSHIMVRFGCDVITGVWSRKCDLIIWFVRRWRWLVAWRVPRSIRSNRSARRLRITDTRSWWVCKVYFLVIMVVIVGRRWVSGWFGNSISVWGLCGSIRLRTIRR